MLASTVDPRLLYKPILERTLRAVFPEYGMGTYQVAAITMHEARNGTHFVDFDCVKGMLAAAAYCIGTGMGGRRPRTVTAILLGD